MKGFTSLLFVCLLLCSGCSRQYAEFIKYHDDGRSKPTVTLLPIIDAAGHQLPWDVSEEITEAIRERLMQAGELYLPSTEEVDQLVRQAGSAKKLVQQVGRTTNLVTSDYVVVMELVDHRKVPYFRQKVKPIYVAEGEISSVLMMMVRLKVLDVRQDKAKVVLQQIVHSNHMIPKNKERSSYSDTKWGSETYLATPMGQAHSRLGRDLSKQIGHYVNYSAR